MLMPLLKQNLSLLNIINTKSRKSDDRLLPAVDHLSNPPLTKFLAELLRNPTSWCMGKPGVPPLHNVNIWVTHWFLPQPSHHPVDPASPIHSHLDVFRGFSRQLLDLLRNDSKAIQFLTSLGMGLHLLVINEPSRRDDQRRRLVREIQRVQSPVEAGVVSYSTEVHLADVLEISQELGEIGDSLAYALLASRIEFWALQAGDDDEVGEANANRMLACLMPSHLGVYAHALNNREGSLDTLEGGDDF